MTYEFDQSGKLENTAIRTVLAYSNKSSGYVYIKQADKRVLKKYFSDTGKNRSYIYQTFACLLYCLIKKYKISGVLIIDIEYPGNMNLIKSHLFRLLTKYGLSSNDFDIRFTTIGKRSKAHDLAIKSLRENKFSKENNVSSMEIIKMLRK